MVTLTMYMCMCLANNADPDVVVFQIIKCHTHQGLHCLLRQNLSSKKEIQYFLEIITCEPSIYTMDHPDFIVCSFLENSISLKRV